MESLSAHLHNTEAPMICRDPACTCALHRLYEQLIQGVEVKVKRQHKVNVGSMEVVSDGSVRLVRQSCHVMVIKHLLFFLLIPIYTRDYEEIKRKCKGFVFATTTDVNRQGDMVLPEGIRESYHIAVGDRLRVTQVLLDSGDQALAVFFPA